LRPWNEDDLEVLITLNLDTKVMEYFPSTLSMQESREMMDRIQAHYKDHGYGLWAAELKEDGKCIGFIGLNNPRFEAEFTPCVEIGWRILPQYWNKGLATEGAQAALEYGFKNLGLSKIYSWTPIQNKPSERVMQKIGMTYQNTFMHPNLPSEDALSEHVIYTITTPEYRKTT